MSLLRSRLGAAALIALTLPLAACGSSNSSSSTGGSGTAADPTAAAPNHAKSLQFAACMRSHGVPNFPDPGSNGSGGMEITRTPNSTMVNGVAVNGPAFQSAMQACRSYLPNGGVPKPPSEAQRNKMFAFARCMRSHGVTNFPDPVFSDGGARIRLGGPGLDPNSPAFQQAQKACGAPFVKQTAP
jgi:hypothetical protein